MITIKLKCGTIHQFFTDKVYLTLSGGEITHIDLVAIKPEQRKKYEFIWKPNSITDDNKQGPTMCV